MKRLAFLIAFVVMSSVVLAEDTEQAQDPAEDMFPLLDLFASSIAIVESDYATDVTASNLIYGALHGMLRALDPHSEFMESDAVNEMKVDTEGQFGGIGIEVGFRDDYPMVITPIEDTPAFKAGLMPKDRITKIDGKSTRGMSLGEAVKNLRGKPGTDVTISIQRRLDDTRIVKEVTITRDIIKVTRIRDAGILDATNGIGYIRVTAFGMKTHDELAEAIDTLVTQNMKSLVLDLRNNGGGLLKEAIEMSDLFLPSNQVIVSTRGRIRHQNKEYLSSHGESKYDFPLVVLVNGASASASEIVCGALKDNNRGIVVGSKTFGKGSVQTVIPVGNNNCALRLTTAKYYTPSGVCIHGTGIYPHITVDIPIEDEIKLIEKRSSTYRNFDKKTASESENKRYRELQAFRDAQRDRAVDLLIALKILKEEDQ
jgi:carboxyl-terminal processing protease